MITTLSLFFRVVRSGEEEPAAHAEAADEILSAIESKLPLLYRYGANQTLHSPLPQLSLSTDS